MDVLALAEHGVSNAVATLGTAVTGDHLENIFRQIPEVLFCFDGDDAGRRAAWRALETALPVLRDGRQAFFLFLPQGEDPDDYIRKHGRESFIDTTGYLPLSDYLLKEITRDYNPAILEHRSLLIHKATPYLKKLPQSNLKQIILAKLAKLTDTDENKLEQSLAAEITGVKLDSKLASAKRQDRKLLSQTVRLLLQEPRLALLVPDIDDLDSSNLPGIEFLAELIRLIHKNPDISCARIIEHWRGTRFEQRLSELAPSGQSRYAADETELLTPEYLESEFKGAIEKLRNDSRKNRLAEFSQVSSTNKLTEEQKAVLRGLNPAARQTGEK